MLFSSWNYLCYWTINFGKYTSYAWTCYKFICCLGAGLDIFGIYDRIVEFGGGGALFQLQVLVTP